jgi:hypothetical protein
LNGAGFENDS